MQNEKWAADYQNYTENPPQPGTVLRCYGDEDALLELELVEGKPPFLYGRAFVPQIVGTELGWFLQPFGCANPYGYKCILLPKSREECIRKLGMATSKLRVRALKLVRYSRSKSSILCEVAEWCPTKEKAPCVAKDRPSAQNEVDIKTGIEEEQRQEDLALIKELGIEETDEHRAALTEPEKG